MFSVTFKFPFWGIYIILHLFPFSQFPEISKIRCNFLKNVCNFLNALITSVSTESTATKKYGNSRITGIPVYRYWIMNTEVLQTGFSQTHSFLVNILVGNLKDGFVQCSSADVCWEQKACKNVTFNSNTGLSENLLCPITTEMQTFALIADGENKKRDNGS